MFPKEEIEKECERVNTEVAVQINEIITSKEWSKRELALQLSKSASTVCDFTNAKTTYNIKTLVEFAVQTNHTVQVRFIPN